MAPTKALANLSNKFSSGNSVEVERTMITREEWKAIEQEINSLTMYNECLNLQICKKRQQVDNLIG